jgi:hypothetical protein
MRGDEAVQLDEALGMLSGLEAPHPFVPLMRWLMGVLGAIVQVLVLPVGDAGHDHAFRRSVAAPFVSKDHARTATAGGPQQLAEDGRGGETIAPELNENVMTTRF